ncbi:dnaJ homolog subfamily C member 13 isoform X2 [Drosophila sulfurigaster albostrigata]|uniref:dnaJ homolog subfamily C member 13 isoform X2 n=1 Tax=Drosophila sulfurigaster albostrigata TaxID=89887 RepID=UPI002D21B79B|nr:dnaJ homolog subfamily C member 13 isoform X2 [Drosophila sulfurigaster albostrigata]
MLPPKENVDLECFIVTKHSWKGKYKRILSIGTAGISTYNPDRFDLTNRWSYSDIVAAAPTKTTNIPNEFVLTIKKDKKLDTIKLSSEYRNDILSSILKYYREFADKPKNALRFNAYKYHWSGISLPTVLEVTPCSLDQLDPTTNDVLASYMYKDIEGIIGISDYDNGIVMAYGGFSRLHMFKALNHHEIVQNIAQRSSQFLGIETKILKSQITLEQFERQRFGKYSGDQFQTSMTEFTVQKITPRHPDPVKRILCLTEVTLLERDPQTYSVCTLRPLCDVFALVRDKDNLQRFCIEYKNGIVRSYSTNDRDSLLATVLDAVRSSGNQDVHIRIGNTPRGKRYVPLNSSVDEETEASLLRLVINNFQNQTKRHEILERFNANVPHSGLNYSVTQDSLFAENKEKLILSALQALAQKELDSPTAQLTNTELEAIFHALTRLLASKVGYAAFTNLPGFREIIGSKIVAALRRKDLAVTYSAIDMINSLMHSVNTDHDLKQEQLNKSSILSSKTFLETLLNMWTTHVSHGSGALVLSAMLDFMTFALCVPYSETTDGKQFDTLLELVADRGRYLYKLFQHPSLAIVKGAGLVLRAIIEEGELHVAQQMQALALDEAALCRHLLVALYTPSNDPTLITHRQLSRHLIGLWLTDSDEAMELFKRIFPAGLLTFLETEETVPETDVEEDKLNFRDNLKFAIQHSKKTRKNVIEKHLQGIKHWGMNLIEQQDTAAQALKNRPVVLRNRRQKKKTSDAIVNLPYFFYNFAKDHSLPNLIWNHKTREELRMCLENELRQFLNDRDLAGQMIVAWNYQEFEVGYQCLADEIKIGDYYIRLILEKDDWPQNLVKDPIELFNALYRRVLCRQRVNDDQMTVFSLQALAKVYRRYHKEIGKFSDMSYILQLSDRCLSPSMRDALINLISCLVLEKSNCRALIDHVQCLVDLITLAHLHKGRAQLNTKTNVIEAGPNMSAYEEKDWYYNIEKDGQKAERQGPITYSELKELWQKGQITPKTRCWAIGMDGWRSLQQIPQLKWCLIAKGTPLYDETELASKILDILIKCTSFFPSRTQNGDAVLIPGPKLSRKLSEFICLPHVVQVCLTHDPGLLERVATLLCQIMEDNPEMPKVYMTGVFYFMLMYTGSNILPITRFLKMTHMKQGFRSEETSQSGIMHRSILGQLLPEAMVCFLENYSADKFAEIFLGEFDTPEVIWSSEMRRLLIEKIAAHIADFTPRLRGHTMARYPYLAIPVISYPQLENELFCHIYYLRHLCDTQKFPNWPISDPVQLLKHTLDAWRKEVEKKPPQMTIQQAYQDLGIDLTKTPKPEESVIRKSYYKLAQMYHPDKNPNGREIFEKVNQAYEFLCSRNVWSSGGPDPNNIVLILRTQSILFERYPDVLRPYKYAGYPQLIKTIRLETRDDELFSKEAQLLTAASELCYHTVHCSALNAEELRREEGIEALLEAYTRCVSILGVDSKPDSLHYQVISNVTRCFEVACNFEKCKQKIIQLPQLLSDVCRVVYFKHTLSVSLVTSLAANNYDLQCNLSRNGVLWSLLLFIFEYDYTLDESGVEVSDKSNQQQLANNLAKMAVLGCIGLAGYSMELRNKPITGSESNSPATSSNSAPAIKPKPTTATNSAYTQNAHNPLQSKQLAITTGKEKETAVVLSKQDSSVSSDTSSSTPTDSDQHQQQQQQPRPSAIQQKYIVTGEAKNSLVKQVLDRLLTRYIANQLATATDSEVLKLLTANTRNPYLIWDNGTRAQLKDFLEQQRTASAKETHEDIAQVYELVASFEFDAHKDELQIGGIFIRIYNDMPTFPIVQPKQFIMDLLEYLKHAYQFLNQKKTRQLRPPPAAAPKMGSDGILTPTLAPNHPQLKQQQQSDGKAGSTFDDVLNAYNRSKSRKKLETDAQAEQQLSLQQCKYDFATDNQLELHITMVLRALIAVIKTNAEVEIQCIGNFDMIFGFLANNIFADSSTVKAVALEVVALVSRNKECVSEVAACEILGNYLVALKDPELRASQVKVLETLSGLMNVQEMIKEAQTKGAVIYLLDMFCNSRNPQIREMCAEILAKMTADRLSGPKVRITISKFLPALFIDAMIESPATSVQLFESIHEHPELIWNDNTRSNVCDAVADSCNRFYQQQKTNARHLWKDPEVLKDIVSNEIVVAGVYLRLFVSNPAWTLRKPKQFLSDLLDFVVEQISKSSVEPDVLDLSTTALVELLRSQPNLSDDIPVLGHIPKLFNLLSVQPKNTLSVLHQLSLSEFCVSAISQTECIAPLKKCMEHNRDCIEKACETLSRLFKHQHDSLISQSLEVGLIPFLLGLLDSRLEFVDNASAVKAQIVAALKGMTHNLNYGDRVTQILLKHPVWAEFKDQRHDLFITDTNIRGYLTGVNPTAGYLTAGPAQNVEVLTSPPPMDRDDPSARPPID